MEQPSLLKALSIRNNLNRYNQWLYNKMQKHIGKTVLDIGSGTGNLVELFLPNVENILCTDLFAENIEFMKNRFQNNCKVKFLMGDFIDSELNLDSFRFDTVTCVNVLEHIEEDLLALAKMKEFLQPSGKIVLLVPAFQFLYGSMDIASGHYRRYNPGVLRKHADSLNLKIVDDFYLNVFGIIPWFVNGKIMKKNKPYSETLGKQKIGVYNKVIPILEKVDEFNPFPIGISEIIILQKD
ncbi:class I SAM-dependent methyltransferase [Phosphitispora sp. TUW77]|uniref:class I SAM-dependent methyltransferase n=1 Tax=Phosphitispora sp. TUW77 TaxID=3152361 RepID=UPI003AB45408